MSRVWIVALLLLTRPGVALAADKPHHMPSGKPTVLAPGYSALAFQAPQPGSYALPPLGLAADGKLLDTDGKTVSLHEVFGNQAVVLSFIYTSCPDVNGCPLASFVLGQLEKRLAAEGPVAAGVRLVSISFDPANDTPQVMRDYAGRFGRSAVDWQFLTAPDEGSLEPLLERYDQAVIRERDAAGRPTTTMAHILRVYLIDRDRQIRNIYSPSFLHVDILLADIRTILETGSATLDR